MNDRTAKVSRYKRMYLECFSIIFWHMGAGRTSLIQAASCKTTAQSFGGNFRWTFFQKKAVIYT
jgi:hypothetical protein